MTDVNQSRVQSLMSQNSRFDAVLSSMVPNASTSDWLRFRASTGDLTLRELLRLP